MSNKEGFKIKGELKHCPNCGSDRVQAYSCNISLCWVNEVYCENCGCSVDAFDLPTAIRLWNELVIEDEK